MERASNSIWESWKKIRLKHGDAIVRTHISTLIHADGFYGQEREHISVSVSDTQIELQNVSGGNVNEVENQFDKLMENDHDNESQITVLATLSERKNAVQKIIELSRTNGDLSAEFECERIRTQRPQYKTKKLDVKSVPVAPELTNTKAK